jgi:hypothetical protein
MVQFLTKMPFWYILEELGMETKLLVYMYKVQRQNVARPNVDRPNATRPNNARSSMLTIKMLTFTMSIPLNVERQMSKTVPILPNLT